MKVLHRVPPPGPHEGLLLVAWRDASPAETEYALDGHEASGCVAAWFPSSPGYEARSREQLIALYRAATSSSSLPLTTSTAELTTKVQEYFRARRLLGVPPEVEELIAIKKQLAWETTKATVDAVGVIDPTPVSDGVGAILALSDRDFIGAGLSLASMLPYLGDALAKTAKGARIAAKIAKLNERLQELLKRLRHPRGGNAPPPGEAAEHAGPAARKAPDAPPPRRPDKPPDDDAVSATRAGKALPRVSPGGPPDANPTLALKNGRIGADDLSKNIPAGTPNTWNPQGGAHQGPGFRYEWTAPNGTKYRVWGHGPNANAPPGSNASTGNTVRIQEGNRFVTQDGRSVRNVTGTSPQSQANANATHISFE